METTANSNKEDEGKDTKIASLKGKSCKGCLFYSSVLNSKSQTPFCFGLTNTLQPAPDYVVSSESKVPEGNEALTDFKYACIGYSVHLEKNIHSTEPEKQLVELPFCVGLKILSSRRTSNPDPVHAHLQKGKVQEDEHTALQPQPQPQPQHQARQPTQVPANGFLDRFARNAGVVATGVKRNVVRVSNHLKKKMDSALDPYRRRSK